MKLEIEKSVFGGSGLARFEGQTIFVPLTLPGETIEARMVRDRGSFAEAELLSILDPSPDRVPAPCPYYGACGGCQYQHADYPAQLTLKRSILAETLARAGLAALPEIATHAGEPWGYRNRIRLHVDQHTHAVGYLRRGSHTLLPIAACPIAAPALQQAIPVLHAVLPAQRAGQWCAAATLFTNDAEDAMLLTCELRPGEQPRAPQWNALCAALSEGIATLRGAALVTAATPPRSRRRSRASSGSEEAADASAGTVVAGWGEPSLSYRANGHAYRVSNGAFFQGNRFLVDTLLTLATRDAEGETAWDLYAGGGLFTRALAERFADVVAVEGSAVSAADLAHNVPGAGLHDVSTQRFLAQTRRSPAPDFILLDPPRAGLGLEGSRALAAVRSHSITYVSCDPATLARDLRVLVDAGYTSTELDLVDMFPQTAHLETVARLQLR